LPGSGKVRAIGSSFFSPEQTVEAQWTAERRGHHRFRTEQPPHSILTRGVESSILPTAQRYCMGVLTFGPLNAGWLSGRAGPTSGHRSGGRGAPMFDLTQLGVQAKAEAVKELSKLAAEAGLPLPHLAVGFVLAHTAITSVLIGPRKPEHLADLLAGAEVELSEDILDPIDEIVPPGVNVNPGDLYIDPAPAIVDKRLRRR
jgi:aryl-alcohol dehydrogenase-like predicted oxidoreductase